MIRRTTADDPAFRSLIVALDAQLRDRYGEAQDGYTPFNGVAGIATAVVAELDGQPVGCGCFRRREDGAIEIKRMFVADAYRRRGIAAQILDALEMWARELGHATVLLETGTRQDEAIALYGKLGYERIPPFPPYVDMTLSICMRKQLT